MNKIIIQNILCISTIIYAGTAHAARTIHNKTDIPLYVAGYYAASDDTAKRQTEVIKIPPQTNGDIDVPALKLFSSKKRYIVLEREEGELSEDLLVNSIRALPHINITSALTKLEGDYYVVDKEGRLQIYNAIEYSKIGKLFKTAGQEIKKEITELVIDKETLPSIKNNDYRSQVAYVRDASKNFSPHEQNFLTQRRPKVQRALQTLLPQTATSRAPVISVILSGGGNRAMFTSCGFSQGLQEIGVLDATTYMAGLSGSTWFMGCWYTSGIKNIAEFRRKFAQTMTQGLLKVSPREFQLILDELKVKYVYHQPMTSMDLFGALLGNALLRNFGDKRYQIYLSDQKNNVVSGEWPFPIYTAIDGSKIAHKFEAWFEFTPYEVGGARWLDLYIPTWAFGRRFAQGVSVDDAPEVSLAFLFSIFGSAFAVDVFRMWQEMEKSMNLTEQNKEFLQKRILSQIGHKRITHCEEFNFTAGMEGSILRDEKYMILVDGGIGTNLPYPVVSGERPERAPDVLIFFEASAEISSIKKNMDAALAELRKSEKYARSHNLKFPHITTVLPQMINIYKDENDPSVPLVIWIPCMFEANKYATLALQDKRFTTIKDFDFSNCITNFCATTNFTYTAEQAEKLMTLGQFCAHACKNEIIEAIAWKMNHITN